MIQFNEILSLPVEQKPGELTGKMVATVPVYNF